MRASDRNRIVILFFLQLPSILWIYWSFKMNSNTYNPCGDSKKYKYTPKPGDYSDADEFGESYTPEEPGKKIKSKPSSRKPRNPYFPNENRCDIIPPERFFWEHLSKGILDAGVCPMGRAGAYAILTWTIVMLTTLIACYQTEDLNKIKDCNNALGYINLAFMAILFGLTIVYNAPLFFRTLPYFFLNIAITITLLNGNVECS